MFCNKCGKQLDDNAKFCTACGNPVSAPENQPELNNDAINPAFDAGEEKTVYLSEENDAQDNDILDTPLTGSVQDNSGDVQDMDKFPDMPRDDLSDDPEPVDDDFLGENKTVLIRNEDTAPDVSADINEQPVPQYQPYQQPQPEPIFTPEQPPVNQFGQYGQIPQGGPVDPMNPANYMNPMNQGGMIPDVNDVRNIAPPYEAPAVPVNVGKGRIFGASVVAFFAIIFLMLVSLITSLKIGASGKTLNKRITKLDLNTVLNAEFDNRELSDNLYGTVKFGSVTQGSASVSDFKEYLKKSDFLEYAGWVVEDYANYIIDGKGKDPSITSEDFGYDFFAENNDAAYEVFDYELSKKDIKKIIGNLEDDGFDDNLSVKEWGKKAGVDLKNVSYVLSYITAGILFALVLVLMIWIAIIVDKKGRHIMGFFGNIFFISGLVVFLCGAGVTAGMMIAFSLTSNVVFYLVSNVLLDFGIIALITGFSELVVGFIFKKISKGLKRKKKFTDAVNAQTSALSPSPVPVYN